MSNRSGAGAGLYLGGGAGFEVGVGGGFEKDEDVLFSAVQSGYNSSDILPEALAFFATYALGHPAVQDALSDLLFGQIVGWLETFPSARIVERWAVSRGPSRSPREISLETFA